MSALMNNMKKALLTLALIAIPAMAQPELVVRIDGEEIANHEEIFFEDTAIGDSLQIVVVLRNESSENLFFTEQPPIMMAGGFDDSFELVQPALEPGNMLSPNGSTAFAVNFQPNYLYPNLFTHVYIWTNADVSPFHLIFSGAATGPRMVVRQDDFVIEDVGAALFPETEVGQTSEVTLTITNEGTGTLELIGDPAAYVFGGFEFEYEVVEQPATVLQPGEFTDVTIAYTPIAVHPSSSRLFIETNEDSLELNGIYDIDLLGEGIAAIADCNENGLDDAEDVASETSEDCNANQVPDECEADSDGDGLIDDCDEYPGEDDLLDSDSDGVADVSDECPLDEYKTEAGVCGCGFDDVDTDGDGLLDCEDEYPDDAGNGETDLDEPVYGCTEDTCGGEGFGGCYCDEACVENGDCCENVTEVCGVELDGDTGEGDEGDDEGDLEDDNTGDIIVDGNDDQVDDDDFTGDQNDDVDDEQFDDEASSDLDDDNRKDESAELTGAEFSGMCGVGGGMAMMMSMLGLCGGRSILRRSVR